MIQPGTPSSTAGSVLQSASHVFITGGTFIGSQHANAPTVDEPHKSIALIYENAAPHAILNAGGRADAVRCFPGTREEVLAKIDAWIAAKKEPDDDDDDKGGIFWLSGPAGAGKSAIVQTLAERCMARSVPMANFFFFRGDYTRNHIRSVVATLLCQLVGLYPQLEPLVGDAIAKNPMIFSQSTHDQFELLIKNPFRAFMHLSTDRWPIVILVDGLDECNPDGKHEQEMLLRELHGLMFYEDSPFIVLVASRPEPFLTMTFNEIGSCSESVFLDENYRPSDDIRLFVVAELARIKNTHHLGHTLNDSWPSEANINTIVDKSSGQFIYAATVLRFIADSSASPAHSLDKVLGLRPVKKSTPFAKLDAIYTYILSQVEDWDGAKDILAAQIFALTLSMPLRPLITVNLHTILRPVGYDEDDLSTYVSDLTAVVRFDHKLDQLEFYHASLSDFLCDSTRSGEYHIDISAFSDVLAPAHIRAIKDFDSLLTGFVVVHHVNQPTPSLTEALTTSYPPLFRWPSPNLDFGPFIHWFLAKLQDLVRTSTTTTSPQVQLKKLALYFDRDSQLYRRILQHWLSWFRDMHLVKQTQNLESVELALAIWGDLTAPKVDLVDALKSQPLRVKKASFWRRILRAT